jgi:hypothetical protein
MFRLGRPQRFSPPSISTAPFEGDVAEYDNAMAGKESQMAPCMRLAVAPKLGAIIRHSYLASGWSSGIALDLSPCLLGHHAFGLKRIHSRLQRRHTADTSIDNHIKTPTDYSLRSGGRVAVRTPVYIPYHSVCSWNRLPGALQAPF